MQDAGDVGRRQLDRETGLGRIGAGAEVAARFPHRIPAALDGGGFETLGEFAGRSGVAFVFILGHWVGRRGRFVRSGLYFPRFASSLAAHSENPPG
ncbi:hypothetical protein SDC9_185333 [bioreactor metagenome]|uniref:Uncharacterized protein n=1 Tax=bioreactor metagenome TaxID=1076179 RepID=A0A645HHE8_9ZZZZ